MNNDSSKQVENKDVDKQIQEQKSKADNEKEIQNIEPKKKNSTKLINWMEYAVNNLVTEEHVLLSIYL